MLEIDICDVFLFDDIHSDIVLRTVNFVVGACKYQSTSLYSMLEISSILMRIINHVMQWVIGGLEAKEVSD